MVDRRARVDHADAAERHTVLAAKPGQLVDEPEPQRVLGAGERSGDEETSTSAAVTGP